MEPDKMSSELTDSVREVIGKKVKISLLSPVKSETKPDKFESRILAFTACRLFILTCKVPSKIETTFNYLDLESIESKKPNQFYLRVDGKIHKFTTTCPSAERVDQMVLHLCTAIRNIFPSVAFERIVRKIDLMPTDRLSVLQSALDKLENRDCGPCGGYSRIYACMCDYFCLPYREEVAWDVDTIYHAHNTREFCLQDFDHLEPKDLIPIISALEHNTWFTRLRASNTKLIPEAADQIIRVMNKSTSIEELILDNIGLKNDFVHKLALALISNSATAVHTLNLASNFIEDKGAVPASLYGFLAKSANSSGANHLSGPICKASKGLMSLNLSRTLLSSKGINAVAHALTLNKFMATTLKVLNLAENSLRDDVSYLLRFLGQPNTLTHLDLSGSECNLDNLFLALSTGCHTHLSHLNVARNVFAAKKRDNSAAATQPLKQFFTSSKSLKHVDLSCTRLTSDCLKSLLLGFASNAHLLDVKLVLSGNDFRSSHATQIMETCLPDIPCLSALDLSECGLDHEFYAAVLAIARNSHLRELSLARNFQNVKPKNLPQLLNALVHLIHDEASKLQNLSISDCRLKSGTNLILSAIGSNQYLKTLDLSGNQIGDAGARILAKSLQVNAKLETILLDNNGITFSGYQDLSWALKKNRSVRHIPYPVFDAAASMKVMPEKFPPVFHEIEKLLWRNQEPQTKSNERLVRLKQGVLFSNSQQMVDQLICQVQESIDTLKRCPIVEELDTSALEAEGASLIGDANRYKQFLCVLHQSTNNNSEYTEGVENLLEFFVSQLSNSVEIQLRTSVENMCADTEKLYPYIFQKKKSFKADTLASARIPQDFLIQCVMRHLGDNIQAKMSEVLLSAASRLSDRVLEDIVSTMSSCHNLLNNAIRLHTEWYNAKTQPKNKATEIPESTKAKSFFPRKINLRPQSIAGNDADMMAIAEALQLSNILEVPPSPTEIPQEEPKHLHKLEHLNKTRPKPKRNRPISKFPAAQSEAVDPLHSAVDEGLQSFFSSAEKVATAGKRLSWNKADIVSQLPNFAVASPTVSRRELPFLDRHKDVITEENEGSDGILNQSSKTPFGLRDRGFSSNVMAEIRAKQEARASGLFNVNVVTATNGDNSGRRSKTPPPVTPRAKPRGVTGRKISGSRTPGSNDDIDHDVLPPPSPTSVSNTPEYSENLDNTSLNSDSGVLNDSGSHRSVRALVSTLETTSGEDMDVTRKAASLPRTHLSATVSRSKSLRSPEGTLDDNSPIIPVHTTPPTPARPPPKGLRLKDRVKSLFNDSSSKEAKTPTATDDQTKVLEI